MQGTDKREASGNMQTDSSPEQGRHNEQQEWDELSRRFKRAATRAGAELPTGQTPQLTAFNVTADDPDGLVELLEARRANAISRWDRLQAEYPARHYFMAEPPFAIMFKPEGQAAWKKIEEQEARIAGWLQENLTAGQDYETESDGVGAGFHIFFKTVELYKRFCAAVGEPEQEHNERGSVAPS